VRQEPTQAPTVETERDRYFAAKELVNDAIGHISRGEQVPDLLNDALNEWKSTAFVLGHQVDSKSASAWWDAYVGVESALERAASERLALEQRSNDPDFMPSPMPYTAGNVKTYESGLDPTAIFQPFDLPEVPEIMGATEMQMSPEAVQRATLLTSPIEYRDGGAYVTDADGMEWDLTEHITDLSRPEVVRRLRQSMMHVIPSDSNFEANTMGAIPTLQLLEEGVHKLAGQFIDGVPEDIRYVNTASPAVKLPWLVPLGPEDPTLLKGLPWRGDEAELAKDPLWTRALIEVQKGIDAKPSGYETFLQAGAQFADFILLGKGSGLLGKAAFKALPQAAKVNAIYGGAMLEGASLSRFPLNAPILRTGAAFAAQNALAQSTNPDSTFAQNVTKGFAEGITFAGMHKVAGMGRTLATAGVKKAIKPYASIIERMTPGRLRQVATSSSVARPVDELMSRLSAFTDKTFSKTVEREALAPAVKETIKGVSDSYFAGVMVHAYHEAQAAPPGEGLATFWRGLFSPQAHATGAGFALNGILQYGITVRPQVKAWFESPAGFEFQKRLADRFAHPDARKPVEESLALFKKWQADEPDLFTEFEVVTPAKARARARSAAIEDQVPTDAAVTFDEMRADAPLGLTMGEFHPEKLRILLNSKAKSDAGVYKHGLNAVNEYLRIVEGAEGDAYSRWSDVPTALARRMFEWRDRRSADPLDFQQQGGGDPFSGQRGAPTELDFTQPGGGTPYSPVDSLVRKTAGNPLYDGLAPLERVQKVKSTPKRPALGRAIELVSTGKKDAAWLRETFPEGAKLVKDGPVESWAGAFERGVREAWKQQKVSRLQKVSSERRKPKTIQDFVAEKGGIRYSEDLKNLTRKDNPRADGRTVVYSEKSGKGMLLDDMVEQAWLEGFFPGERPDINEFVNALFENRYHPNDAGLTKEAKAHEASMAARDDYYRAHYRDEIESGAVDIPLGDDVLMEVYAGDPRYIGMEPARIRKDLEQLRSQADAGDPGAAFAEPMPTANSQAKKALEKTRGIVRDLQGIGKLNLDVGPDSPEAMEAVARLARGEPVPEGVDPAIWEATRTSAIEARESMRDAMRRSMEGSWDDSDLVALNDMWAFTDARANGQPVAPEIVERLKPYIDEFGALRSAYVDRMQQQVAESLRHLAENDGDDLTVFASGLTPITFSGRKFTDVEDNRWGGSVRGKFTLDSPRMQGILGSKAGFRAFKVFAEAMGNPIVPLLNLGPLSRPQSSRTLEVMQRQMLRFAVERGRAEEWNIAAATIGKMFTAPWGGRRAPQDHYQFFYQGMEDGSFSRMKGPESLPKDKRYLWNIYERTRDLFEDLGREYVRLGLMTREQFEARGGGKYLSHLYVREQMDSDAAALGAGQIPMKWMGRAMLREEGVPSAAEPILPIHEIDPAMAVRQGAWQESQVIRVFSAIREVADDVSASLTAAQVKQLGAFDQRDYVRAAVRPPRLEEGETIFDAIRRQAKKGEHPPSTYILGARLASILDRMSAPGKVEPGKIPHSPEIKRYVGKLLGEGKDGPIFIPKPLADELEISMSDIFTLPNENVSGMLAAVADMATSFWKRGLTTMRPANWALMIGGNAIRNHVNRGVPLTDFLKGVAGGESFTRSGIEGQHLYFKWLAEQSPDKKPDSWTDAQWSSLQRAKEFVRLAGPSTSAFVTLGPELAASLAHAYENPYVVRDAWMRELDARAAAGGWAPGVKENLSLSVQDFTGRLFHGLEGVDAKILGWMGSNDPAASAKSLSALGALYNATDLFLFKYPAYLKAAHENPTLPMTKVVSYALQRTGHAQDTHPRMRRYLSMRAPWHDKVWRAAQKSDAHVYAKMFTTMLLRGRFFTDNATMMPMALAPGNLPRNIASMALASGLGAAVYAAMNDDDRKKWQEEAATAKRSLVRPPTLSSEEEIALKEFSGAVGTAFGGQPPVLPEWAKEGAVDFWRRLKTGEPWVMPAPSQGGESRIQSFTDLLPLGQAIKTIKGAVDIPVGLARAGESSEAREQALQGIERIFGVQAQSAAQLALGIATGETPLFEILGGGNKAKRATANLLFDTLGKAGFGYPTLGLFSPEGKFLSESVFLGGQSWNQYFRGIRREQNPQEAASNLMAAGMRVVWPSRSLRQREPLRSPVDNWSAILAEMYPGVQATTAEARARMQAHKWVAEQMSVIIPDVYEEYLRQYPNPDNAEVTLDESVAGAIAEMWANTMQVGGSLGEWIIDPAHEPKTALLQAVAALPERDRSVTIDHLRRWVSRDRFAEDGMTMLLEAGRRLEMSPGLFREAFRNALLDPDGGQLVAWWWSQAKDADADRLGELAPLIYDVQIPSGGERLKDYQRLMMRYLEYGLEWPPVPEGVFDYSKEGQSRAVQGGRAMRNVLLQSPERSAIDKLLEESRP